MSCCELLASLYKKGGLVFQSVILNKISNHIPSNLYIHLQKISLNINVKVNDPRDIEIPCGYVAVLGGE